ncbi:hypothetical protein CEY02_20325, partial [Bacillus pumilus]
MAEPDRTGRSGALSCQIAGEGVYASLSVSPCCYVVIPSSTVVSLSWPMALTISLPTLPNGPCWPPSAGCWLRGANI